MSMKTSYLNQEKIPLVIEPKRKGFAFADLLKWIEDNRDDIKKKILAHGGILLRGFPIEGAQGFNEVIQTLKLGEQLNYIGGDSPRDKVQGKVYTSTEAPPKLKIPLHNEMSFIKHYPKHIYFYCATPAQKGGATILGDARKIFKKVKPDVRARFEEKGLKYVSNYYRQNILLDIVNKLQRSHKTWMEVFETDQKEEVERRCRENEFSYKWHSHDWLQISQKTAATIEHPQTKEKIWFNQAHLYDFNPRLVGFWNWIGVKLIYMRPHTIMHEIFYQDGNLISKKDLYHVIDVLDDCTISYPWQKNDMAILDNVLLMHGRAPFSGKRKILTALTK
ncbi:MAG: TauD/TfdA family dioxygenase [Chlamydiales bacterium]